MKKTWKKTVCLAMSVIVTVAAFNVAGIAVRETKAAVAPPELAEGTKINTTKRVSVHDPSVVYGNDGYYYIFGSHMAWARSKDLTNWSQITTNINTNYATIFATPGKWAERGGSNYNISGNLWAPDVIYNETMGKWCMYMSVNGDNYCSSIALATADKITGPYTYQGIIVYSGFTASGTRSYTNTDYQAVTGSTDVSRFLSNGAWNSSYGTNAIDPCVTYDENGDLWMSYGSWFGGIYMLKLDKNTGLRDTSYTYKTETNKSDAYMGLKIAGGYGQSGEGSYIVYDESTGYYYLYLSYCGLNATDGFSGYHLRMYRSQNITGPYTDAAGRSAIYTSAWEDQSKHGVKLFGNYSFSSLSGNGENSANGYMSGGHNSAFIDEDGEHFLVYHTRFNVGQEWHEVRVHQQFMNEDGWLVTAPYEYRGSKISETGYSLDEIVGSYEIINHGLAAATQYTGMLETKKVILMGDGTIAGDGSGTWSEKEGTYYATMNIDGIDYKGVFFKQYDESSSHKEVMTFSLIGEDNTSIWGSKVEDDLSMICKGIDSLFGASISGNINIPSFGDAEVTISTDSNYLKISEEGTKAVYTAPEEDTSVIVTAQIKIGNTTSEYTTAALVKGYDNVECSENLVAYYQFEGSTLTTDYSGNNHTLTNYGTTAVTDSERGTVAYFSGNSAYMQVPSDVTDTDDFTFMAWVKSSETNAWERIFDFGDGEGNSLFLTSHAYNPERVRASYSINSEETRVDAGNILATDQWIHLAVTIDSKTKKMSLYVNGVMAGTMFIPGDMNDYYQGTKNYIGKSQYSVDAYFKGYMDDVAIFNDALSADQIQQFMENGLEKDGEQIKKTTGVLVMKSGAYVDFGQCYTDKTIVSVVSENPAVARPCADYMIRSVSEGTSILEITYSDNSKDIVIIHVEDEQDVTYGDVNSDGLINVLDMEKIQKSILGIETLNANERKTASIVSFDDNISVRDMEKIQKHILGIQEILQLK